MKKVIKKESIFHLQVKNNKQIKSRKIINKYKQIKKHLKVILLKYNLNHI